MNRRIKKIISLITVLALVTTILIPVTLNAEEKGLKQTHDSDWMSLIPDKTPLSTISIPGTHDSATFHSTLGYCTSCQDKSMYDQMLDGFRYIDARLELNENKDGFIFTHGGFKCKESWWPWSDNITFHSFCEDAYKFLQQNPTETIIVAIKAENSNDDVATVEKLVLDEIDKNPDKWYTKNEIPNLGDVRGKIVLATRYDDALNVGDEKSGLHFCWEEQNNKEKAELPYALSTINSTQNLWVQDRFKYKVNDKFEAFEDSLDNCLAGDNTFFINFLSLSGQNLVPHPKGNADTLNAMFEKKELSPNTCYGVVVVDRGNSELAEKIYNTNL